MLSKEAQQEKREKGPDFSDPSLAPEYGYFKNTRKRFERGK